MLPTQLLNYTTTTVHTPVFSIHNQFCEHFHHLYTTSSISKKSSLLLLSFSFLSSLQALLNTPSTIPSLPFSSPFSNFTSRGLLEILVQFGRKSLLAHPCLLFPYVTRKKWKKLGLMSLFLQCTPFHLIQTTTFPHHSFLFLNSSHNHSTTKHKLREYYEEKGQHIVHILFEVSFPCFLVTSHISLNPVFLTHLHPSSQYPPQIPC